MKKTQNTEMRSLVEVQERDSINSNMIGNDSANHADYNDKVASRFNSKYTPTSVKEDNYGYYEYYSDYYIYSTEGNQRKVEVYGNPFSYKWWFNALENNREAKACLENLTSDDTNEARCYNKNSLSSFRDFLIRYMNGEFKVAKERKGNRGSQPKARFYNELPKVYQNNIKRMITAIEETITYITNDKNNIDDMENNQIKTFGNAVDFALWIDEDMVYQVLPEFWHWYKEEERRIYAIEDEDLQEEELESLNEREFSDLPLPSLDARFSICGKCFAVRDALSIASYLVSVAAEELPDTPDGWKNRGVQCTNGVREYAHGFYAGVWNA